MSEEEIITKCQEKFTLGIQISNSNLVKCYLKPKIIYPPTFGIIFEEGYHSCIMFIPKVGSFTVWKEGEGFAKIVNSEGDIIKENKINKKLLLLTS